MGLGDFGNPQEGGFNSCYEKTVDMPQHFRAKPKQAPKLTMWQQSVERVRQPDYEHSARFGCRAKDHDDLLTTAGASGSGSAPRLSKRCGGRPPTATIVNTHPVGGHTGTRDPNESGKTIHVGKKLIEGAAHKTQANICDPSRMPDPPQQWPRKREAEFSSLNFMTIGDPSKYQKDSKGKRQHEIRHRTTTGANQWLKWDLPEGS